MTPSTSVAASGVTASPAQALGAGSAALAGGDALAALFLDVELGVVADGPTAVALPGDGDAPLRADPRSAPRERGRRFQEALAIEWSMTAPPPPDTQPVADASATPPDEELEVEPKVAELDTRAPLPSAITPPPLMAPFARAIPAMTAKAPATAPTTADAPVAASAMARPPAQDVVETSTAPRSHERQVDEASGPPEDALPLSTGEDPPTPVALPEHVPAPLGAIAGAIERDARAPTTVARDSHAPNGGRSWVVEPSTRVTVEVAPPAATADPRQGNPPEVVADSAPAITLTTSDLVAAHQLVHERAATHDTSPLEGGPASPALVSIRHTPDATRRNAADADTRRPEPHEPNASNATSSAGTQDAPSTSGMAEAAGPRVSRTEAGDASTVAHPAAPASSIRHVEARGKALENRPDGATDADADHVGLAVATEHDAHPRRAPARPIATAGAELRGEPGPIAGTPAEQPAQATPAPEPIGPTSSTATPERTAADVLGPEHELPRTLRMTLEPPEGGSIEVRVELRGESVHAQIVTTDESLGASFSSGRDDLREHLRQRDLHLAELDVSTGGGSHTSSSPDHGSRGASSGQHAGDDAGPTFTGQASTARHVLSPSVRSAGTTDRSRTLDVRA